MAKKATTDTTKKKTNTTDTTDIKEKADKKQAVEKVAEKVEAEVTEQKMKGSEPASKPVSEQEEEKAEKIEEVEEVQEEKEEKREHKIQPKREKPRGKKYKEAVKNIEKDKVYPIAEAVELAKKTSTTKFDASVEVHIRLTDLKTIAQVRGMVTMPAGTGKTKSVAVFCEEAKQKEAKDAGADFVGADDLIEKISGGWTKFDIAVATPSMMPKLARVAKILGTRGLMPNPKSGTVTDEIGKTVGEIKKGKIEFRADAQGIVHQIIGKVSFKSEDLIANYNALLDGISKVKPGIRANIFKTIFLSSSMGPSVKVKVD